MSADQNERIMRTYLEEVAGNRRIELLDELANDDMIDEGQVALGGPSGRAGLVAHVQSFYDTFDDVKVTIHRLIANDDEVMAWWSIDANQRADFIGAPPTGDRGRPCAFSFFKIRDGKIAHYSYVAVGDQYEPPVIFNSAKAALQTT